MADYFEIKTSRAGKDGKTYWTRIGTMFHTKDGAFKLTFDALPIPTIYEGVVRVDAMAFKPLEKGSGQQQQRKPSPHPRKQQTLDDDIPF